MSDLNFLEKQALAWAEKVVKLYKTPVPPQLQTAKNNLIATAKTIKEKVESLTGKKPYLAPMDQLGFIVPVVVGGVAWAIAAIVKWTTDYDKFNTEVEQFNSLVKGGMTPDQAANVMNKQKQPFSINWMTVLKFGVPLAIVGGVYLAMRGKRNGNG